MRICPIAPSHLCTEHELDLAAQLLTDTGHQLHTDEELVQACMSNETRLAISTANRLLKSALMSGADIIWAARGGYGASRLIPFLLQLSKPAQHSWFVGSSDATALHLFFNQQWHWPTIHGVMLTRNSDLYPHTQNATHCGTALDSVTSLIEILRQKPDGHSQKQSLYRYPITPLNRAAQETAPSGILVGGNLAVVCATLATANQIEAHGKILLIEDVNESAERIERMLEQLLQAKITTDAAAVCFGQLDDVDGAAVSLAHPLLQNHINSLSIPCYHLATVGHGTDNLPLVLGAHHRITTHHTHWQIEYDDT